MAKILRTGEQQKALSVINHNLHSIAAINNILSSKDAAGDLIYITSGDRLKLEVTVPEISPLITGIRKTMTDEVNRLSKQYFINLDAEDMAILQGKSLKAESYEENRT